MKNKWECLKCKRELFSGDKVLAIGMKKIRNSIRYVCPECANEMGINVDLIKLK